MQLVLADELVEALCCLCDRGLEGRCNVECELGRRRKCRRGSSSIGRSGEGNLASSDSSKDEFVHA